MHLTSETFSCGHIRSEDNTNWSRTRGKYYGRCLMCHNTRQRILKDKKRRAEGRPTIDEARMAKKNKPLSVDHLKLPIRAVQAESELHLAMEEDRAKCEGREAEWIDYEEPPNRSVARAMCEGCPLLRECGVFADASRAVWGVWGGNVYVDGRAI